LDDPSILFKIGSRIGHKLKGTFLPTMFNPGPSKQPSICLPVPPQPRVPYQRPTSVPLSQAKPLNKPAFHFVESRPPSRLSSPPDTVGVPPSQQPPQQPAPPSEAAPPPPIPKTPKQVRMSAPQDQILVIQMVAVLAPLKVTPTMVQGKQVAEVEDLKAISNEILGP